MGEVPRRSWIRVRRGAGGAATSLILLASVGLGAPPAAGEGAPAFGEVSGPAVDVPAVGYRPVVGHFTDGAFDTVIWYRQGATPELAWTGTGDPAEPFAKTTLGQQVTGAYQPLVGDFAGDRRDDILWYATGSHPDFLWTATGDLTFTSRSVSVAGAFDPIVLRNSRRGGGKDDIFWHSNLHRDYLWAFADDGSGKVTSTHDTDIGTSQDPDYGGAVTGDFDGNHQVDILWEGGNIGTICCRYDSHLLYRTTQPGRPTFLMNSFQAGKNRSPGSGAPGPDYSGYTIAAGAFAPTGRTDAILWSENLPWGTDRIWLGTAGQPFTFTKQNSSVPAGTESYQPAVLPAAHTSPVFVVRDGPDVLWTYDTGGGHAVATGNTDIDVSATAVVGHFIDTTTSDVLWYRADAHKEHLFYRG